MTPPLSVLDLSPVVEGGTAAESFRNTRDLARHAERWGYRRFWLAEHHNMPGIGSSATAVLIGYVAEGTSTIRVGAGGVMLPNHSPLIVAEQFGTLESLYPGRIDLGLGRAPGTDQETMMAIRRDAAAAADRFPEDVAQLLAYFRPEAPGQRVRAVPGEGLAVPGGCWDRASSARGWRPGWGCPSRLRRTLRPTICSMRWRRTGGSSGPPIGSTTRTRSRPST